MTPHGFEQSTSAPARPRWVDATAFSAAAADDADPDSRPAGAGSDQGAAAEPFQPRTAEARSALAVARRARAEAIAGLVQGTLGVEQVLDTACTEPGSPLRKLRLGQLLRATPGVGEATARRLLDHVRGVAGHADVDPGRMTVSWLVDRRCGGSRYLAWVDARAKRQQPWPGWPFTGDPAAVA